MCCGVLPLLREPRYPRPRFPRLIASPNALGLRHSWCKNRRSLIYVDAVFRWCVAQPYGCDPSFLPSGVFMQLPHRQVISEYSGYLVSRPADREQATPKRCTLTRAGTAVRVSRETYCDMLSMVVADLSVSLAMG